MLIIFEKEMNIKILMTTLALMVSIVELGVAVGEDDREDSNDDKKGFFHKVPLRKATTSSNKFDEGNQNLNSTAQPQFIIEWKDFFVMQAPYVSNTVKKEANGALQVTTDDNSQDYQLVSTPFTLKGSSEIILLLEANLQKGGFGVGVVKADGSQWFLAQGFNTTGPIIENLKISIGNNDEIVILVFTNYSRIPSISEFSITNVIFRVTPSIPQSLMMAVPQSGMKDVTLANKASPQPPMKVRPSLKKGIIYPLRKSKRVSQTKQVFLAKKAQRAIAVRDQAAKKRQAIRLSSSQRLTKRIFFRAQKRQSLTLKKTSWQQRFAQRLRYLRNFSRISSQPVPSEKLLGIAELSINKN